MWSTMVPVPGAVFSAYFNPIQSGLFFVSCDRAGPKPLMILLPLKLHRIMYSSFPTSRHTLIATMTKFDVIFSFFTESKFHQFSLQSKKYLNSKLLNTLIIFNNRSDATMTSFIIKKWSGTIRLLGSAILNLFLQFPLKPVWMEVIVIEIKRMLMKQKKVASFEIPREINAVQNWTKICHLVILNSSFFSIQLLKSLDHT